LLVRAANTSVAYGTAVNHSVVSAQYLDGANVIQTLTASSVAGNTYTYDDGAGGQAVFTLGPVAPQLSSAGQLRVGNYGVGSSNVVETSANFSNTLTVVGNLAVTPRAITPVSLRCDQGSTTDRPR